MLKSLKKIIAIQDLDMKMIRLVRLKKERGKELSNLRKIKEDLAKQYESKDLEVKQLKHQAEVADAEAEEVKEKIKKFEQQQHQIKKVEEFNALSQEMAAAERERLQKEQKASDLLDQVSQEEDLLVALKESLENTAASSQDLEKEIVDGIEGINEEGRALKEERQKEAEGADEEVLKVYERLMQNKRDYVIVPIENRTCTGCHIVITAQQENVVRKGERLTFCEHCSRIQYWPEVEATEEEGQKPQRRRRRTRAST